jgi:hypothetical protein
MSSVTICTSEYRIRFQFIIFEEKEILSTSPGANQTKESCGGALIANKH